MPWISQKKLSELSDCVDALNQQLAALRGNAYLIGIERKGRANVFTFVRNDEVHVVETVGMMSDNIPHWKEKLLK